MGVWATPFEEEKDAKELVSLLKKPITMLAHEEKLYNLMGCDDLWDMIAEDIHSEDIRPLLVHYLKNWLEEIDRFVKVNPKAVSIIEKELSKPKYK